ncbi:adenosylcobinamide amidohydrolase [Serinicoccus chungangensis]|uniref:adenosylcobinamide amidohydrolase n=1 Tax=Serinicoccus chungangensis TaxID=767452 RepID=UPI0011198FA4|nr:adenosylcobinamide amidohydrolase [Serinicoccus chungangensis]
MSGAGRAAGSRDSPRRGGAQAPLSNGADGPTFRVEDAARALVWDVPGGWVALSSAAVGGGIVRPRWVTNLMVDDGFDRVDLEVYAEERAAGLGLTGPGTTLLTAADVRQVSTAEVEGVRCWATVGVTKPTWAVAPARGADAPREDRRPRPDDPRQGKRATPGTPRGDRVAEAPPPPGTINVVVALPVALSTSALVQAVGTVTEAKAQVLVQAGVPGTGTASDAVAILCPAVPAEGLGDPGGPAEAFAGVRSVWGQRLARAVHAAVAAGLAAHPWRADAGAGAGGAGVVW